MVMITLPSGLYLNDHVRALIDHPDVVVDVDSYGVREHMAVRAVADFTHESPVLGELEQLCCFTTTGEDVEVTP